jgi:hypothetical protein
MKINRNNYEIYFLDYFEGELQKEQIDELMQFLEANLDLKKEFSMFENISIDMDDDRHIELDPDIKNSFKKEETNLSAINLQNYTNFFIAYHEDDLQENIKKDVEIFVENNKQLESEFLLFGKLQLKPDTHITYPKKQSLKQGRKLFFPTSLLRYAASLAAIMVIAYSYFYLYNHMGADSFNNGNMSSSRNNSHVLEKHMTHTHTYDKQIEIQNTDMQLYSQKNSPTETVEYRQISPLTTQHNHKLTQQLASNLPLEIKKRDEFTEVYNSLLLRQLQDEENQYTDDTNTEPRLFDRVISLVNGDYEGATQQISQINGWQVAEYGIRGFNFLTNKDFDFKVKNNDAGEINKVAINEFGIPIQRDR